MANTVLDVGKRAPAFTLPNAHGERTRLTDLRGRWVVVYFYAKNQSNGCATQARDFRDSFAEFKKLGAVIFGVGAECRDSHAAFIKKEKLPFDLLVDRDSKLAIRYGAHREKGRSGFRYHGIVRSTFLIDPSGRIVHIWDNLRVKGHVDRVLKRFAEELQS
ncbi:MAG: peroxiredoxin [Planctomycetes bacterium]|nr:peroxiredoxin [Planctomycetota bacterium]MCP4771550.1 peroxiredoxin [Planctomycetota bacterium]MCP4861211.1 peroxiredoxin [Planctomycetota bacterium]